MEKIIAKGRNNYEKTTEYKIKKRKLRKKISDKYSKLRETEVSFLKRMLLKIKERQEFKNELQKLNPLDNLFLKE